MLGALPLNALGASTLLNYDGVTDQFFTSNSLTTPSPAGITLTYSISGGTATAYVANLAIKNTNSSDWSANWIVTWGLDRGETISSYTNCTATIVGRTLHAVKATGAGPITAGSTLNVTVNLGGVTGSSYTTPVIFAINGVIIRTQSPAFLSTILTAVPEGHNNSASASLNVGAISQVTPAANSLCYLTFLNKSAVLKNSLGYFSYPSSSTISSPTQVTLMTALPYLQVTGSGGSLNPWTTIALPYSVTFTGNIATPLSYVWPANTCISFFVGADAWNTVTAAFNTSNSYNTWYSLPAMNIGGESHWATLITASPETPNTYVYCFEDCPLASSDKDYNDAMFQIRFN